MWGESSDLRLENNNGSGLDSIHVRNKVTQNYEKLVFLRSHMWKQYLWCRLSPDSYLVFGTHKNIQKKGKNPDSDTMDGNTLLWVTQKACVSHGQILLQ